ncbi:antibiotic biosynthesis monooxygenase [Acinetobacter qingfengensis]|uniref:Antibiotic biosynthesis monooxygenase n=1 Tax=Acinetobacter qingfengensis TaxID=1262585 RepID=A0A1E7RFI5_9GAMM|nr:putative quinol monooxygenase [Acinetobacter qingfengensis]KAA8731830.1 antibiotic biosynthesis monooxygenase [Acinetobacter qingfengensis]OEY98046.1 antibiotic biosynthesis monooxygenase [Acinetobacter qingfengensis]
MLKLIAEDFIKNDQIDQVLPLYQELIEKTRQESGCIAYDLYHDLRNTGHFVFIEEWQDRAALDLHIQSEHFQRLVPLIEQYQREDNIFTHMQHFQDIVTQYQNKK